MSATAAGYSMPRATTAPRSSTASPAWSSRPRTFARRFLQVTGTTPGQWLLEQRLALGRRLLETTDQTVEWIAHRCGFGSAATLRHQFAVRLATSPRAYRATFRGARVSR